MKILVYVGPGRDDAIGENIMKLPMLRAIRTEWPDAEVTWVHGDDPLMFQGILKDFSHDLIDIIGKASSIGQTWRDAIRRPPEALAGPYDLIIDTQRKPQITFALRRIPHRMFISPLWRFALSKRKPPVSAPSFKDASLPEQLLCLLSAATGVWQPPDPVAPIPDAYHEHARLLLPSGPRYAGFALGAGNTITGKVWPVDKVLATAKAVLEDGYKPVFLLGPNEKELVSDVRQQFPEALIPEYETISGMPAGIPLLNAIGGRLAAAVSNCSGSGHVLAAGGAPMVSLFGPTNPRKFRPYARRIITLRAQDFGSENIEVITVDAVRDAIKTVSEIGPAVV